MIQPPSAVLIGLDAGPQPMSSSGPGDYRYQDIVVRLKEEHGAMSVTVESPTQPLHFVRLEWQLSVAGGVVLADEWERTYEIGRASCRERVSPRV